MLNHDLLSDSQRFQGLIVRIVNDANIIHTLKPLQMGWDIASLSVFYGLYHGECFEELFELISYSPFHYRTTRVGLRYQFPCETYNIEN